MKIWPKMEQRSEQWFQARAGRPTASEFKRIVTPSGELSGQMEDYATELVAECLRPDEVAFMGNRHTDRGEELEPEARETFEAIMKIKVEEVGFVTRSDEVVGCSPDGLINNKNGKPVAGLEIKCPLPKNHAKYILDRELPVDYKQQVHGSMAVTGLNYWYFMSYCQGMKPFIIRVERDNYTRKVSKALDRFLIFYSAHRNKLLPLLQRKEVA